MKDDRDLPVLRLQYEQATRVLDRHAEVLSQLRSRASVILAATGIVASVFGGRGLDSPHPILVAGAAVAFTWIGLGCCIFVMWPVQDYGRDEREWRVTLSAPQIAGLGGRSEIDALRTIIEIFSAARVGNHRVLNARTRFFNGACVALVLQIALWSLLIAV